MKIKPHSMNWRPVTSDVPGRSAIAMTLLVALTGNASAAEKQNPSVNNSKSKNVAADNSSTPSAQKSEKQSASQHQNNQKSQTDTTTLKAMTVVGETVQDPDDPYNKSYTVTNSSTAMIYTARSGMQQGLLPATSHCSTVFTGSYQNNNSFRDFDFTDRMLFAPSVSWRPTEATDATLELQVMNQDFISDFGIPVIGKRPAQIPISRSLGDPNTPASNINQVQLGSLLNHRFNEDWAIHSRFLATWDYGDETFVNPAPAFKAASALDQTTGIMQRNVFNEVNEGEDYATNLDLTGRFNLGFSKHEVLAGFDFYRAFEN